MTWLEIPTDARRAMEHHWQTHAYYSNEWEGCDGQVCVTARVIGNFAVIRVVNPCECEQYPGFWYAEDTFDDVAIRNKARDLFSAAQTDLANYRFDMAMLAEMEQADQLAEVLGW